MEFEKFMQIGKTLGLEKEDLQTFVKEQMRLNREEREREREMFYLTMHSTHFIYGYMASDIWLRTILIVRKETRCRHIGYSFRLTARVLLYAPSHRQDNTYHGLCYTSRGALAREERAREREAAKELAEIEARRVAMEKGKRTRQNGESTRKTISTAEN